MCRLNRKCVGETVNQRSDVSAPHSAVGWLVSPRHIHTLVIQTAVISSLNSCVCHLQPFKVEQTISGRVGFVLHSSKWCLEISLQSYCMDDN